MFSFFICLPNALALPCWSTGLICKYARIVYIEYSSSAYSQLPNLCRQRCYCCRLTSSIRANLRNQQATKLFKIIFSRCRTVHILDSLFSTFGRSFVRRWLRRRAQQNGNPIFECRRIRSELSFRFPFEQKIKLFFCSGLCNWSPKWHRQRLCWRWCGCCWFDARKIVCVGKSSVKFIENF